MAFALDAGVDEAWVAPAVAAPLRTAGVAGLGAALPEGRVSSAEVAARLGVDEEWIVRRTGIRTRRRGASDDRLCDLAAAAGAAALTDAGLAASELDLVLVATLSGESVLPSTAPLVAHALGARRAGAFDVGAACTGFVSALGAGAALIEAGRADRVLVVGAELLGRLLDPADRRTAPLFGDGAGAVVLTGDAPGRVGATVLGADGAGGELIRTEPGSGVIRMDGHATYGEAVTRLAQAAVEVCGSEGVGLDDVDLFVFHQANARILRAVAARLDLPAERVVDAIAEVGNTSAASIPLALAHARAQGRLLAGTRVLLAAFGAGLTWGAAIVEWGRAALPSDGVAA